MAAVDDDQRWQQAWQVELRGVAQMQAFAQRLAKALPWGTVVALVGELGAGKTTFTQGLAQGLGVFDLGEVLSPTYTLINEYPAAEGTLVHVDLYRLKDEESAISLGVDEALNRPDAVAAVEWADHLPGMLPRHAVWLRLSRVDSDTRRCEVAGIARPEGI